MHCSVLSFPSFQKTLPMFPWRLSCVFSKAASLFPAQSQLWNLGEVSDLPQLSLISSLHEYNVCTVISPMEAEGRAVFPRFTAWWAQFSVRLAWGIWKMFRRRNNTKQLRPRSWFLNGSLDCVILCWETQDKIPTFWYLHSGPALTLLFAQVPWTPTVSVPVFPSAQHDFLPGFSSSGWSSLWMVILQEVFPGTFRWQLPWISYFLSLNSVSFTVLSYSWEFIYSNNIYRKPGRDKVLF